MDVATTSTTTPPSDSADAPQRGPNGPLQSPNKRPVSVVAHRRVMQAGAFPVRRSPRLSCLPPSQPPGECQDTSSNDESESAIDVALQLSREETPENDVPPDEPSTMLANRILRANDNPSPPPQDLAHPGVNYTPGQDGQFPFHAAPPSPFRPINLLERLNQLSDPPFDLSRSLSITVPGDRLQRSESSIHLPHPFISSDPCSPLVASVRMESAPREDLESTAKLTSPSAQYAVDDISQRSSQRVCEPAPSADHAGIKPSSSSTQSIDSSFTFAIPLSSRKHLPGSGQRGHPKYSLLALNAGFSPSDKDGEASLATEAAFNAGKGNDEDAEENNPFLSEELQESKCTKGVEANSHPDLDSLSPHSTSALSEPIEQTILSLKSPCIEHTPATPPQTPRLSFMHPNLSWSTVQRPVIPVVAPTPVQANSDARKLIFPDKLSSEVINDICRTPAQRVPIETALARGNSSLQKTIKLSTRSGHSQLGHFPTIRALVFTRPALDDPSRSPAKRIPITDSTTSPTRGQKAHSSPMRFGHARSASAEPLPPGPILARSRSVEPCPTKPDSHERLKESIFPMIPMHSRSGTKLPFPLVPGQQSGGSFPPPIHEENEAVEIGDTETDATLVRVVQGTLSQLRQPSANSRIPRIGNKPYTRPPSKKGKVTVDTTTLHPTRAPKPSLFQNTYKNSAVRHNDIEPSSIQPTNDLRLVGSLKRKRGAEIAAPSNSHPVIIRQVTPGILSGKYALRPAKNSSQVQVPLESSPLKVTKPLKFRKVVDGMISARYAPAKADHGQTELADSAPPPPSLIPESSSINEDPSDEKLAPTGRSERETSPSRAGGDVAAVESSPFDHTSACQSTGSGESSNRPRRTSRTRKPAQQQYVLDVFSDNTTRPPPARRKSKARTEDDSFMGMSGIALKALTTSNTTKNQQTVAVLATEVVRKEGLRPESPTVKARTILQKQRDERDTRVRERAQRRAQRSEGLGTSDTEGPGDRVSPNGRTNHAENDYAMSQKHCRGPGEDEDYETPERPERISFESLSLEDRKVKPVKQVKWHRGLSSTVYVDDIDPRPKPRPRNVVVRGCLAPTSKTLPLDPLGNLVDIDNRPFPELVTEQITVKKYLYDDDIVPEPLPTKVTRSKGKKSKS